MTHKFIQQQGMQNKVLTATETMEDGISPWERVVGVTVSREGQIHSRIWGSHAGGYVKFYLWGITAV
jgi:hypothetical protein